MIPDFSILYELGVVPAGVSLDEAYREWYEALENPPKPGVADLTHGLKLWLIVRMRAKDFSEHIDYNDEFEMYLPKKGYGELWAITTTHAQIEQLLSPEAQRSRTQYLFLIYRVRIKGEDQWTGLLDFLARNQMIEQEQ